MTLPWKRLIRLEAKDGQVLRGEPILPEPDFDLGFLKERDKFHAKILSRDDIWDTTGKTILTDELVAVKKLLGPLAQKDIPILRCIGLAIRSIVRAAYALVS
jgi:hypothetical protein